MLSTELASRLAQVALANIDREYPRRVDHLMGAPQDELRPRVLHPAFFGAYDWHSAVHMHWLLLRILRLHPVIPAARRIAEALDAHLSPAAIEKELAYFVTDAGRSFERPYGWAWLLELQAEALAARARWSRALSPLATELAGRFAAFTDLSPYPVRAGSHANSAFACVLALDYARQAQDPALELAIRKAARRWYAGDRDAPLSYEPSLDDFLSPALVEALLMQQVLEPGEFFAWVERFAPQGFSPLAAPPTVADHGDPKQSHLDALCFSRAWCFSRLGDATSAERLLAAGLPHALDGEYAATHWLASFVGLALGERP